MGFMIMRLVNKEVYGYVSIQVALYMSLSMFFAKEAVRKAAIRDIGDNRSIRSSFNLVQLTLPLNLIMTGLATAFILFLTNPSLELDYFVPSILCWAASLTMECYLEAYYVYMTLSKNLTPRVTLETVGVIIKTTLNYLLLTQNLHLISYAASQLVYNTILLVGYPYMIGKE